MIDRCINHYCLKYDIPMSPKELMSPGQGGTCIKVLDFDRNQGGIRCVSKLIESVQQYPFGRMNPHNRTQKTCGQSKKYRWHSFYFFNTYSKT